MTTIFSFPRTIVFHPEGNTLFSGSHDTLKIHQWEPGPRTCDVLGLGWGKIRDMAVSGSQLVILRILVFLSTVFNEFIHLQIGVSYSMSNVSVYVVDLKRVSPFNGKQVADNIAAIATPTQAQFKGGMRRSFVKDKAGGQRPQVKVSDEQSDKSGTDPEDSDGTAYTSADINDVQNYESIFRPRRRELNRTPPAEGEEYDEPFQAPLSGSESENNISRYSPTRLKCSRPISSLSGLQGLENFADAIINFLMPTKSISDKNWYDQLFINKVVQIFTFQFGKSVTKFYVVNFRFWWNFQKLWSNIIFFKKLLQSICHVRREKKLKNDDFYVVSVT